MAKIHHEEDDLVLTGDIPEEIIEEDHSERIQPADSSRIAALIHNLENDLRTLKQLVLNEASHGLSSLPGFMPSRHHYTQEDAGIEGVFDGERMVADDGKSYQVPPNYASKSKLIEGDPLKLYIAPDGKYVYKQLGPVERRTVPGTLRMEGSHYVVDSDEGSTYSILTACVTYYMSLYNVQPGDRVQIMIPAERSARWAVIDNVATE